MKRGRFITLEGMDGAGKTTHLEWLQARLQDRGIPLTVTREPGGTALGESLRELLLHGKDSRQPETEALLMFAARHEHIVRIIGPALAAGRWVLCDRFTDATFAYQGGGRGFDLATLRTLEQWVQASDTHKLAQPDLTVWFDLNPLEAAKRLAGARVPDKFEAQPVEFFSRVAQGYADRLLTEPSRFARINAAQSRDAVWQDVLSVFTSKGWL